MNIIIEISYTSSFMEHMEETNISALFSNRTPLNECSRWLYLRMLMSDKFFEFMFSGAGRNAAYISMCLKKSRARIGVLKVRFVSA